MRDWLKETLEGISAKLDGLERRRRIEDTVIERITRLEERARMNLRWSILAMAALTVAVNALLHLLWRW
jgi:hypothetical protein